MPAPSPGERVRAYGTSVREVLENQQTVVDDRMGLLALDMGNEAYPAGVMFVCGIVKALTRRQHGMTHFPIPPLPPQTWTGRTHRLG